ncbi:MAG: hypothetical protein HYZ71_12020 [Deltaproteobacteria bacterium]|nr:hypothetical protein [Deltaproteobacteria bacterium]
MKTIVLFNVLLSTLALAAPETPERYSLSCHYNASRYHAVTFRLNAEYVVTRENEGKLSNVQGLLFADPDLSLISLYEGDDKGTITNVPKFKAKSERYKGHLKFVLKTSTKDYSSADPSELIIAAEGANCVTKPWDNGVNTGTAKTCDFHAGLEYHFSDQDGNRTQIECVGVHTVVNRE